MYFFNQTPIYFAARLVQSLFDASIYFIVRTSETVTVARHCQYVCSLSVLLSTMGMTCTTQTVLVLVWWPSSEIILIRVWVPCLQAVATIWGWCLFCSRASDCAATIRGWGLFEGGDYLSAASIWRNSFIFKLLTTGIKASEKKLGNLCTFSEYQ